MPIISQVGRNRFHPASLIGMMYLVLVLGSVTMVYPFLIWLSKGISSEADVSENVVCPRYLYSDDALFRKYLNMRYAEEGIVQYNAVHGTEYADFSAGDLVAARVLTIQDRIDTLRAQSGKGQADDPIRLSLNNLKMELEQIQRWKAITLPDEDPSDGPTAQRVLDYYSLMANWREQNPQGLNLLFRTVPTAFSLHLLNARYQAWLLERPWMSSANTEAERMAILRARYGIDYEHVVDVIPPRESPNVRTWTLGTTLRERDWKIFREELFHSDPRFFMLQRDEYSKMLLNIMGSVYTCNLVLGTNLENINAVAISSRVPGDEADKQAWFYQIETLPPDRFDWIDLRRVRSDLEIYLTQRFEGDLPKFNRMMGTTFASFAAAIEGPPCFAASREGRDILFDFMREHPAAALSIWPGEALLRTTNGESAPVDVARFVAVFRKYLERALWVQYVREWAPAQLLAVRGADAHWSRHVADWFTERQEELDSIARRLGREPEPFLLLLDEEDAAARLPKAEYVRSSRVKRLGPDGLEQSMVAVDRLSAQELLWRAEVSTSRDLTALMYSFIVKQRPEDVTVQTPDKLYREFLLSRYGSLEEINRAHGLSVGTIDDIRVPYALIEKAHLLSLRGTLKGDFLKANFRVAFDYLAARGNALWNTIILISATILAGLTVNPFCAYALSRFKLPYSHNILLFCLATMAFPSEVTAIPNFLMIKELGMLNTYWALILPGLANGYSIFILKGFFDSLPQELFEAGTIDGATEWQMFYRVAMPLSKPVLAVTCLGIFLSTYSAWFFAIIICQNPDMWTIAVFLYQFYDIYASAPQITTAAQILASVPIFVIFILAQRVILRGIVVPQMK